MTPIVGGRPFAHVDAMWETLALRFALVVVIPTRILIPMIDNQKQPKSKVENNKRLN
jgi:hypothetical protein